MGKLKLLIGVAFLVLTAILAAWDATAYVSPYDYGRNYGNAYDYGYGGYGNGFLDYGRVEVVPSGPVYSAIYPPNMYLATGLRAPSYVYIQPPVYTTSGSYTIYPYYGMLASRYGRSQFYGGVYSGYSGSYGSIGNYGRYGGRFVY